MYFMILNRSSPKITKETKEALDHISDWFIAEHHTYFMAWAIQIPTPSTKI